ncbi:MAG: MBL fold metallo-hydrolase [Candidatus Omnitrophica bacterium]|jgi:7,8-dihydropterin-6-yl-methyl-4-(beta-D-ribofuranosyl)aminobenzene 5'-phosphate synthase|nr:MBL fold metallo-hydrolase [Candidatus Omnitrophota bacterium]
MQIKVIAVGSTKWERFIRRWGVSFLIGEDVLFDTFGDPGVLLSNISKLHIDTAKIKHIVLSHDDWDHISGLWNLINNRKDITVYVCPGFKQEIKDRILSFGVKLVEAGEVTQIKDNIYSSGELVGESEGRKICEQSVVIKTGNGLTVICGCAHPGVVNIIKHVQGSFKAQVYSLFGGFHLKDNPDKVNLAVIDDLRQLGVHRVAPMHCTGKRAVRMMVKVFGRGFVRVKEKDILEL